MNDLQLPSLKFTTGDTIKHKVRGSVYQILGAGFREHDLEPCYIYQDAKSYTIWIRPVCEVEDGRFEQVTGEMYSIDKVYEICMIKTNAHLIQGMLDSFDMDKDPISVLLAPLVATFRYQMNWYSDYYHSVRDAIIRRGRDPDVAGLLSGLEPNG